MTNVDGTAEAVATARAFLAALEARNLEEAAGYLAADAVMTFPGGNDFRDLESLTAWAAGRYRSIAKSFERFEVVSGEADRTVVYCFGTLSGELPDGEPFGHVRFIDRFEIRRGLIERQMVWNDLTSL